jgi:carboxyl-terminal processing protease
MKNPFKLVLCGAMFTGTCLVTLLPLAASSAVTTFKDSPKAVVDEVWQIVNNEYNGGIVKTVDRQGKSEDFSAAQHALTQLPMAVLVDGNSASASEILTGALKDNHRAQIVGAQTFGKALVQSIHPLADGSGMAVTVAHYYTPNGTDIGHKGVTPDVKVQLGKLEQETLDDSPTLLGSALDPQYQKAIAVLENNPNLVGAKVDPTFSNN